MKRAISDVQAHKDPRRAKWRKDAAATRQGWASPVTADIDKSRPGIFVTCFRNKEKQAAREARDLFEHLVAKVYPSLAQADIDDQAEEEGGDIEQALAREVQGLKGSTKSATSVTFDLRNTDTPCLLFLATPPQVDPIRICEAAVEDLVTTGTFRYRHIQRVTPVSSFCSAISAEDVDALAAAMLRPLVEDHAADVRYRIDFTSRSHSKPLSRDHVLEHLGSLARSLSPATDPIKVDLERPTHVLIVEAFKHLCGMSLVSTRWYEGPPIEGRTRGAGRFRRFGLGAIADDIIKARAADGATRSPEMEVK